MEVVAGRGGRGREGVWDMGPLEISRVQSRQVEGGWGGGVG